MIKRQVVCGLLMLCSLTLAAQQSTYYRSNSIGQPLERLYEIDLYDQQIQEDYVLTVSGDQQTTMRELRRNNRLVWTETVTADGSNRLIQRRDQNGIIMFSQEYSRNLLVHELFRQAGTLTEYHMFYDEAGRLVRMSIENTQSAEKSFFLSPSGLLQGLIYDSEEPGQSYSLLTESGMSSYALGLDGEFTLTHRGAEKTIVTEYREGRKRIETVRQPKRTEVTDFKADTRKIEEYDQNELIVLQQLYKPIHTLQTSTRFFYDDHQRLTEKTVRIGGDTTRHLYSYGDGVRTETISQDDQLIKKIRYNEGTQVHTLFIDGEYYATVTYNKNNEIESITYEQP
jgi:YD repeat-containing protein